eukprot:s48_g19.t1
MATPKATPKMTIREDQSWLVKNLDTGEERYVKNHEEFGKPLDPKLLSKDVQPWRSWWQEQRRRNQELLRATQVPGSLTQEIWATQLGDTNNSYKWKQRRTLPHGLAYQSGAALGDSMDPSSRPFLAFEIFVLDSETKK